MSGLRSAAVDASSRRWMMRWMDAVSVRRPTWSRFGHDSQMAMVLYMSFDDRRPAARSAIRLQTPRDLLPRTFDGIGSFVFVDPCTA
jgi:hypothetical protein